MRATTQPQDAGVKPMQTFVGGRLVEINFKRRTRVSCSRAAQLGISQRSCSLMCWAFFFDFVLLP